MSHFILTRQFETDETTLWLLPSNVTENNVEKWCNECHHRYPPPVGYTVAGPIIKTPWNWGNCRFYIRDNGNLCFLLYTPGEETSKQHVFRLYRSNKRFLAKPTSLSISYSSANEVPRFLRGCVLPSLNQNLPLPRGIVKMLQRYRGSMYWSHFI